MITPETLNEVEALCQPGRDVSAVCDFAYTGGVGDLIRYIRHLEAGAAVMREALEVCKRLTNLSLSGAVPWRSEAMQHAIKSIDAALATDVGKETLAALVELRDRMEPATRAGEALLTRLEELETLLRRIVTYAREDRASTPGFTRLGRALVEAERLIGRRP